MRGNIVDGVRAGGSVGRSLARPQRPDVSLHGQGVGVALIAIELERPIHHEANPRGHAGRHR